MTCNISDHLLVQEYTHKKIHEIPLYPTIIRNTVLVITAFTTELQHVSDIVHWALRRMREMTYGCLITSQRSHSHSQQINTFTRSCSQWDHLLLMTEKTLQAVMRRKMKNRQVCILELLTSKSIGLFLSVAFVLGMEKMQSQACRSVRFT